MRISTGIHDNNENLAEIPPERTTAAPRPL